MKSKAPIALSRIVTCVFLLAVVCFASCGRACNKARPTAPGTGETTPPVAGSASPAPSPDPTAEETVDDSVTPSQSIAARITSSVRQLVSTVFRIRGSSRPLTPDRTYPLKTGDRIKTDVRGTAEVKIAKCMTIYVFESSGLTMSTCPGFARGNVVCSKSGTSLFNNSCYSHIRKVETDTAEIKLEGTYFRVAYWPEKKRTIIDVQEGPVEVRQLLDADERKFDKPVKIREGCWCAPSDECFVAGVPSDGPQPCTKLTPENAAYLDRTTEQTARRIVLDNTPIAPGPTIEVLEPNPSGPAPNDLIDFGPVEIGSQTTRSLTITNISSLPLKFESVSVLDPIQYFGLGNNSCTSQLKMGTTCKIEVTFKPADLGVYRGSLKIADNAKWSPREVSLRGAAVPWTSATSLEPRKLEFELQTVGTTSRSQLIRISKATAIAPPVFEGPGKNDFKVVSNNCVDASRSCEIEVAFEPLEPGNRSATLVISPLKPPAGTTAPRIEVALHGEGTPKPPDPPALTPMIQIPVKDVCFNSHKVVDPKSVEVRKSETVFVRNAGKGPLVISSIVPLKKEIVVESQDCIGKPVTEQCKITVGFTPQGTGVRYAKLAITSNDPQLPTANMRFAGRGKSRNWFIRGLQWVLRINQGDKCDFR